MKEHEQEMQMLVVGELRGITKSNHFSHYK